MTDSGTTTDDLLRRAKGGETAALGTLFAHYRDRLRHMIRLRLDRRLVGRFDASDVLQEAYLDVARRYPGALPQASSASLAQQLLAGLTSPTQAAVRAEMQLKLQEALNGMDPMDREVVVLRHFEELNNVETAAVLGIEPSAASKRYLRAIRRLKAILDQVPGFFP